MSRSQKRYAYTIALWERGQTVPSLFRKLSDYKSSRNIPSSPLWTAMLDPSHVPWPLRCGMAWLRNRDANGDLWNMCHFWSNFEIGDLEFFRGDEYRALFDYLDQEGGFYYERWGMRRYIRWRWLCCCSRVRYIVLAIGGMCMMGCRFVRRIVGSWGVDVSVMGRVKLWSRCVWIG